MATWTIPQSADPLNGPLDSRITYHTAAPTEIVHGPGNQPQVAGSGAPAAPNPTLVRKHPTNVPLDNLRVVYDGARPHYFAPGLGEVPAPSGNAVFVSRL